MKFLIIFAFIAFIGIAFGNEENIFFFTHSVFSMYVLFYITAQQCAELEEYQECGTACPTTCENRNKGPVACIAMCKTGCFCKSPYIRSELSGQCVLTRDCGV
jgi:hypothetical protein